MFGKAFEILSCHYNMTVQNRCHKIHKERALFMEKTSNVKY